MVFRTVFDVVQNGYTEWGGSAWGLIFVFAGALMLIKPGLIPERIPWGPNGKSRSPLAWGLLCFGLLFSFWTLWVTYSAYERTASLLREKHYKVVEGRITGVQAGGSPGKYYESFAIGTKSFSYYSASGFGFNQVAILGGPIRSGLYVRIAYSGNTILRLEIAR